MLAWIAFAQTPDRTPLAGEWGYRPVEGDSVAVNPPALSWVHEKDAASYSVEWADNDGFRRRIRKTHPRLLVHAEDLRRLRAWAREGGRHTYEALIREADRRRSG